MFRVEEPFFRKHTVLRAKALEDGMTIPRRLMESLYSEYSDGILAGVGISQRDDWLIIEPGVIHYQGRLYYMEKQKRLPLKHDNTMVYVRVRFMEMEQTVDSVKRTAEILMSADNIVRDNEMELCHFQWEKGAVLKNHYRSFQDFGTLYNTINIIDAPYATLQESTISPVITRRFGEEMLQRELSDPYDIAFSLECARGEAMNRKCLVYYINRSLHMKAEKLTNKEIHKFLSDIIEVAGRNPRGPMMRRSMPRIMT